MTRFAIVLVLASFAAPRAAAADPPTCRRWHNQLTACAALGLPPDCAAPVGVQKELVNAQLYSSTALKNCKQLITKLGSTLYNYTPGETIKACTFGSGNACQELYETPFNPPADGAHAYCLYDANNDGSIDYNDVSLSGGHLIYYELVTPEPHCFCTAKGPYDGLKWAVERESPWAIEIASIRRAFPRGLKTAVLAQNKMTNGGIYKSDAILANSTASFDPEPILQKDNIYDADAAEIDHIIPRVDSQGCLCGEVTPNNAAVISRQLNASMSNISPLYNADRAKMFAKYVTCPNAAAAKYQGVQYRGVVPSSVESIQSDESVMDVEFEVPPKTLAREKPEDENPPEVAGCSTSGGLGGLAIGLALVGLRRRRQNAR